MLSIHKTEFDNIPFQTQALLNRLALPYHYQYYPQIHLKHFSPQIVEEAKAINQNPTVEQSEDRKSKSKDSEIEKRKEQITECSLHIKKEEEAEEEKDELNWLEKDTRFLAQVDSESNRNVLKKKEKTNCETYFYQCRNVYKSIMKHIRNYHMKYTNSDTFKFKISLFPTLLVQEGNAVFHYLFNQITPQASSNKHHFKHCLIHLLQESRTNLYIANLAYAALQERVNEIKSGIFCARIRKQNLGIYLQLFLHYQNQFAKSFKLKTEEDV
jgi:hypothetical protein